MASKRLSTKQRKPRSDAKRVQIAFAHAYLIWRVPNCTQNTIMEILGTPPTSCKRFIKLLDDGFGVKIIRVGGLKYGHYELHDPGILELAKILDYLEENAPGVAKNIASYCKKNGLSLRRRKK